MEYSGYTEIPHGLKSSKIFQWGAPLQNEHESFRKAHLSLVYVVSFMTFRPFVNNSSVHSFTSYSRLSDATFAFTKKRKNRNIAS